MGKQISDKLAKPKSLSGMSSRNVGEIVISPERE